VKRILQVLIWTAVAALGAVALGTIAFHRGEPINATWFVLAAACFYLVAFRFYSAFISAKLLALDNTRATPAERRDDGRDFVPTNKWVLFGHHFAAIAGPGPLVGPTLAAQFGYLPGTLWLIAGAAFAGVLVAPITLTGPAMGAVLGLKAFSVAIIGGLSSGVGVFVGGLILGIAETVTGYYLSTGYKDVPGLVLLLLVLSVKPSGLFGKATIRKV